MISSLTAHLNILGYCSSVLLAIRITLQHPLIFHLDRLLKTNRHSHDFLRLLTYLSDFIYPPTESRIFEVSYWMKTTINTLPSRKYQIQSQSSTWFTPTYSHVICALSRNRFPGYTKVKSLNVTDASWYPFINVNVSSKRPSRCYPLTSLVHLTIGGSVRVCQIKVRSPSLLFSINFKCYHLLIKHNLLYDYNLPILLSSAYQQ